jgi:hypothetical protein
MVLGVLSTYFTIKRSFCKSRLTLTVTKMKNKITKYHTVKETILKSSRKINNPNTHTWPLTSLTWYMHFNKKWQGNLVSIVKWCGHASVLLVSLVKWCVFHMWVTRNKRTIWYDRPPQWKEQLKNIYKHGERSISSFSYNGP